MPKTTPKISYSLKDRGRKHTGQPRNFNIKALYDSINGPSCQETVASRGMVGYYGHMPRVRFGLIPSEGVMDGGRYVPVEPAFVTTHLRMSADGVIEHQAEFADTASGALAAKLFDGKIGGFSSAIDEKRNLFAGFDYVMQPNYLGNSFRGISLDDVFGGDMGNITYDDVFAAEQDEHAQAMIMLLDSINNERAELNAAIERLEAENAEYLSMLSREKIDPSGIMDSAGSLPIVVDSAETERLMSEIRGFRSIDKLPVVGEEPRKVTLDSSTNTIYSRFMNRFLR